MLKIPLFHTAGMEIFSVSLLSTNQQVMVLPLPTLFTSMFYATEIDGVVGAAIATLYSASTVGQLTATDVDRGTVFRYEQVGAPIDGLFIDGSNGSWSFDPSHESYQDLRQGETTSRLITRCSMRRTPHTRIRL